MAFVYSETELTEIIVAYQSGTALEVLAEKYNKSVASVRMKLVKQGAYQKTTPVKAIKTASVSATESASFPATKGEIATLYKECLDAVGPARW